MTSSWTRRLYKVSGIKPSKITHVGRVSGDRLAEANGVSEDQISKSTALRLPVLITVYRFAAGVDGTQTDSWLLSDHPTTRLHAWYSRFRSRVDLKLSLASRRCETTTLIIAVCLTRS